MGAGSAKGLQPKDNQDDETLSNDSDNWGHDHSDDESGEHSTTPESSTHERTPEADRSGPKTPGVGKSEDEDMGDKKDEGKRRGIFTFSRKKEEEDKDKVGEFVDGNNESDDDGSNNKKKKDSKNNKKKEEKKGGGFSIFGWRKGDDKKKLERSASLDKDIDDLEKTFDTLGIVGRNNKGGDGEGNTNKDAVDDLELLEPMRKRKNVRVRGGPRGMNGVAAGVVQNGDNASNSSRRTFRYSWETDESNTPKREEDEWEYKAVVIEGFDIEKFRKANVKDQVFDSTSLPNAVGDDFDNRGVTSPLRYDPKEQQILASIERDFIL